MQLNKMLTPGLRRQ